MAKSVIVRIVLSMAAVKGWCFHQMDINNAFFHEDLDEEVYTSLPFTILNFSFIQYIKVSPGKGLFFPTNSDLKLFVILIG